jgi:hypothetical protein
MKIQFKAFWKFTKGKFNLKPPKRAFKDEIQKSNIMIPSLRKKWKNNLFNKRDKDKNGFFPMKKKFTKKKRTKLHF